jgi:hypothetical protein
MRSWLASPTAALIGFLAAIMTIVQVAFVAAKWTKELIYAKDKQLSSGFRAPPPSAIAERGRLCREAVEREAARRSLPAMLS